MKINVLDAEAALESGAEAAQFVGGVQRTQRTNGPPKGPLDARPGNNRTPRHQKLTVIVPELEETQAPVVALSAVSTVKPPEKKEGVDEMNNNAPVAAQTRPEFEFEICPICGFFNKSANRIDGNEEKIHFLVCMGDHKKYLAYTAVCADQMVSGKRVMVMREEEWVLSQLDLVRFDEELKKALAVRDRLTERVAEKIEKVFGGQYLPLETLNPHKVRFTAEMKKEDYYLVRRLFARLKAAQKLKPELEQRLVKQKAAETAQTAEALAPTA